MTAKERGTQWTSSLSPFVEAGAIVVVAVGWQIARQVIEATKRDRKEQGGSNE